MASALRGGGEGWGILAFHPTRRPLPTLPGIRDMRQLGQSVRQAILSAKPPRSIDLRASARIAARLSILFLFFFLSFSLSLTPVRRSKLPHFRFGYRPACEQG